MVAVDVFKYCKGYVCNPGTGKHSRVHEVAVLENDGHEREGE